MVNVNQVSLFLSLRDISFRQKLQLRDLKKLRIPHAYNNWSIKEKNEEYLSTVDKR